MSDNIWEVDDDTTSEQKLPQGIRDHVKNLEKKLKEQNAAFEKAQEQIASLTKANAATSLSSILKEKKVSPRIAKWIAKDEVEPTEEAITKWLSENGEDFGYKPGAEQDENKSEETVHEGQVIDADDVAMLEGYASLDESRGAGGVRGQADLKLADMERAFAGKQSMDELIAEFKRQGVPMAGRS